MNPRKASAGVVILGALTTVGVDASILNERPYERIEQVAEYRIEARQIGNRVETTFPWKDQHGIKVVADLGEPSLRERIADKRSKEIITEHVDFGDGGFKVDLILNERPDTNVFCYTIEGAENYDFFYQPPLTEQERAEGAERPPEIEGSYAVYHKTLENNDYKTGKVMHIPRPQVWSLSNVDTKVWADLEYRESKSNNLCITVPQDFLDAAIYPVRVDPTFGYTSVGASTADTRNIITSAEYAAPSNADVSKLTIAVSNQFAANTQKGAIYTSAGASSPLEGSTDAYIRSQTLSTFFDFDFSAPVSLVSGTYLLAVWSDLTFGASLFAYDTLTDNSKQTSLTYTGTFPATIDFTSLTTNRRYSIYATYTEPEPEPIIKSRLYGGTRIKGGVDLR